MNYLFPDITMNKAIIEDLLDWYLIIWYFGDHALFMVKVCVWVDKWITKQDLKLKNSVKQWNANQQTTLRLDKKYRTCKFPEFCQFPVLKHVGCIIKFAI